MKDIEKRKEMDRLRKKREAFVKEHKIVKKDEHQRTKG